VRNESVRAMLARIRREALRRRRITEPPAPKCAACGYSLAQAVVVSAYKGEMECSVCADARREYHRAHGGGVSLIRITAAPSRAEIEAARERARRGEQ